MAAQKFEFFTHQACRFVSGSLTEKRTKDFEQRPIAEDKQRYEFGIAIQKTHQDTLRLINEFHGHMGREWANSAEKLAALNAYWQNGFKGLSMKISDGDAPSGKNQTVNSNTVGCYVLWFSTSYEVKTVDPTNQEIPVEAIKRGFFVQVAGNIVDNEEAFNADPSKNRAGIYINPSVVRLVAEGDIITGGVDAATAFQGTVAADIALPAGARPLGSAAGVAGAEASLPGVGAPTGAGLPGTGNAAPGMTHQANVGGLPGVGAQAGVQHGTASPTNITPHTAILGGPAGGGVPGLPGA